MKHSIKSFLVAVALASSAFTVACALAPAAVAEDPAPKPPGPTTPLTILSAGKPHAFQVEVADTPEKSELGLMYRKEMAKDHGMIFDFGPPTETEMWMKNTFIPLDMVFFDTDGTVLTIVENARPQSLRLIDPGMPVRGVIELNAGVVKELGIKPGDKVQHAIFSKPPPKAAPVKAPAPAN
jgi:uncharacterized membrane protein (UPF0127 family)